MEEEEWKKEDVRRWIGGIYERKCIREGGNERFNVRRRIKEDRWKEANGKRRIYEGRFK